MARVRNGVATVGLFILLYSLLRDVLWRIDNEEGGNRQALLDAKL
jgi:hypothetical protein